MQFSPLISEYLYIPILLALIGAAVSIFTDIKSGKIKNFITLPLILIGMSWSLIFGDLKLFLVNLILTIIIGFAPCIGGRLGTGDIKLNMGIAACLQPMLNVLYLAFFFVTLLIGAVFVRLRIHGFKLLPALKAMKEEIYMELGGVKMAGQISHGSGVKHLGAPIIFIALVSTLIRAHTGGLL